MQRRAAFVTVRLRSSLTIDRVLAAQGLVPINRWRHFLVRECETVERSLDHRGTKVRGKGLPEFELGAPTEPLLTGSITGVSADAHAIDARVHSFVDDR